jgi:hypothetical protein
LDQRIQGCYITKTETKEILLFSDPDLNRLDNLLGYDKLEDERDG